MSHAMHQRVHVALNISPQKLNHYYDGTVNAVVARTTDGRTIRFPANVLRSVVQMNGVHGIFELVFDENHRFVSIKRIQDD